MGKFEITINLTEINSTYTLILYRRTESYHSSPTKGIVDNRSEQVLQRAT